MRRGSYNTGMALIEGDWCHYRELWVQTHTQTEHQVTMKAEPGVLENVPKGL